MHLQHPPPDDQTTMLLQWRAVPALLPNLHPAKLCTGMPGQLHADQMRLCKVLHAPRCRDTGVRGEERNLLQWGRGRPLVAGILWWTLQGVIQLLARWFHGMQLSAVVHFHLVRCGTVTGRLWLAEFVPGISQPHGWVSRVRMAHAGMFIYL